MSSKLISSFSRLTLFTKQLQYGFMSNPVHCYSSLSSTFNYSARKCQPLVHNSFSILFNKNLMKDYEEIKSRYNFQIQVRNLTMFHVNRPDPTKIKKNLRYEVYYPEDGKYTVQNLKMRKLGGRDPETGRKIYGKIGGGSKRNFRWVIFDRCPPDIIDPLVERVIHIQYDPNRTARIALVGHDDKLRFILATATMKAGDLITSTRELPRNPIRPKEGDAHPVGALPPGTQICCVEVLTHGPCLKVNAGCSATVLRKQDDKVIVQISKLNDIGIDPTCLATIGQISNPDHNKKHIGSAQRARWLGIRPSSGLWQRKDGRYGFKRKYKQPVKYITENKPPKPIKELTITGILPNRRITQSTLRVRS